MVKRIKRKYRLRICQCEDLKDIINSIKTSDGIECYWCGIITKGDDITVDHYVPINKGGTHTWDNIVPACRKCNSSKGDKLPMDYIAYKLAQGECININRKDLVYEAYLNQICFCE
jgi:5-methylcytosine-specific restriction endonuclease McrA